MSRPPTFDCSPLRTIASTLDSTARVINTGKLQLFLDELQPSRGSLPMSYRPTFEPPSCPRQAPLPPRRTMLLTHSDRLIFSMLLLPTTQLCKSVGLRRNKSEHYCRTERAPPLAFTFRAPRFFPCPVADASSGHHHRIFRHQSQIHRSLRRP